jgi:hypothetical protein
MSEIAGTLLRYAPLLIGGTTALIAIGCLAMCAT